MKDSMPKVWFTPRWWFMWVLALAAMALTASLGRWQLSRADQKRAAQAEIEAQISAPILSLADLQAEPALWGEMHRRVSMSGFWLHRHTLYLDNRVYRGQPGFWVYTPLLLDDKSAVLVQRGWVARDVRDVQATPTLPEPTEMTRIQGRLALPPSKWLDLGTADTPSDPGASRIRHNIDVTELRRQWGISVLAVVLQTDPTEGQLVRDWPQPADTVSTNLGYAFQWFAMCAALFVLSLWGLIIRPLRHERQNAN
jgi:surfeit locus 1 family protein